MNCGRKQNLTREAMFDMVLTALAEMTEFSLVTFAQAFPRCECGGLTRLDFVSFGESVQALPEATSAAEACDLMLIVGTSGLVYPAAALPGVAKSAGARLIEINWKESELTPSCDLSIRGQAADALPRIMESLETLRASGR
jgi:NAD-dependent SIR2 family protein deacetylase